MFKRNVWYNPWVFVAAAMLWLCLIAFALLGFLSLVRFMLIGRQ